MSFFTLRVFYIKGCNTAIYYDGKEQTCILNPPVPSVDINLAGYYTVMFIRFNIYKTYSL